MTVTMPTRFYTHIIRFNTPKRFSIHDIRPTCTLCLQKTFNLWFAITMTYNAQELRTDFEKFLQILTFWCGTFSETFLSKIFGIGSRNVKVREANVGSFYAQVERERIAKKYVRRRYPSLPGRSCCRLSDSPG